MESAPKLEKSQVIHWFKDNCFAGWGIANDLIAFENSFGLNLKTLTSNLCDLQSLYKTNTNIRNLKLSPQTPIKSHAAYDDCKHIVSKYQYLVNLLKLVSCDSLN